MFTRNKNRRRSRKVETGQGWWHERGCSCATENEQCREGGYVSHRVKVGQYTHGGTVWTDRIEVDIENNLKQESRK